MVANSIRSNWEMMAPFLIKENSKVKVEQIKLDKPGCSDIQIFKLLLTWREQTGHTATLGHLFYLIRQARAVSVEWGTIARELKIPEAELEIASVSYIN